MSNNEEAPSKDDKELFAFSTNTVWPILGILAEVVLLVVIILICERRNKRKREQLLAEEDA